MAIKCLIIDDEPLAIQIIKAHLEQVPDLELVHTFQNPLVAFEFIQSNPIDLIFLDIQMPLLTGIDLIKSLQNPPAVIFTTAHRNYAIESYELEVIDYLLKPITFIRFFKAINKYKKLHGQPTQMAPQATSKMVNDHMYVNSNKKYVKVEFEDILFVESIKDYVRIHTPKKNIITKDKISDFSKKLPVSFLRVHRSFIVNSKKITAFTALDIEVGEKEIPIGSSYKKDILNRLKNFDI